MTELATEMALKCLAAGGSVIIDDGFWYRKQRDEIRGKLKTIGAETRLYYVNTTVDLMKERTIRRSENPPADSFYITEQEFTSYLKIFEPPSSDEEYSTITAILGSS